MIDQIVNLIGGISADIWMFISIGLILLAFIVALVLVIAAGDVNKFKKAAKILIANPDSKNGNVSAKQMPVKVTKLYKRVRTTGEKPGDVIGIDACIHTPYHTSLASKFAFVIGFVSFFAVVLTAAAGYVSSVKAALGEETMAADAVILRSAAAPAALVAVVGLLFTAIAFIISAMFYKNAVKVYDKYIAAMDTLSGNGGFDQVNLDAPVQKAASEEEVIQVVPEPAVSYSGTSEPAAFQPQAESFSFGAKEPEPVSAETDFAPAYEAPVVSFERAEEQSAAPVRETITEQHEEPLVVSASPRAAEPPVAPVSPRMSEPAISYPVPPRMSEPAISYPVTTAQDLRARAEQARQERAQRAAEQVAQEPQGVSGSADELIARIEKASSEGAPLSTLKEIAIQLQQERQKPENKTPEMSKKLSEAQVMLIKAMSSAMRR